MKNQTRNSQRPVGAGTGLRRLAIVAAVVLVAAGCATTSYEPQRTSSVGRTVTESFRADLAQSTIVHLVEPEPVDQSDPIDNYRAIGSELEQYSPALKDRPEIVVCTQHRQTFVFLPVRYM